jgi:hypothetical protein
MEHAQLGSAPVEVQKAFLGRLSQWTRHAQALDDITAPTCQHDLQAKLKALCNKRDVQHAVCDSCSAQVGCGCCGWVCTNVCSQQ